jgi:hypothetical protein
MEVRNLRSVTHLKRLLTVATDEKAVFIEQMKIIVRGKI